MSSTSLFKFFSGSDIFVSYRRSVTGKRYALGLTEALAKRGLNCFMDEQALSGGEDLPRSLRNAIRKSKMFVIVATDDLADSTWVPQELTLAQDSKRRIVPIDIAGAVDGLLPQDTRWSALRDRSRIEESAEALAAGEPSAHVSERVDQAYVFTRRRVAAIRVLFLAGLVFFGLSVAAIGASVYAVQVRETARLETARLTKQAVDLRSEIERALEAKQAAQAETATARTETSNAQRSLAEANSASTKAQSEARIAKKEKAVAENEREKARADATQQIEIAGEQRRTATALQLANSAEIAREKIPSEISVSALLALKSLSQRPTAEGDQALRRSLTLMPRLLGEIGQPSEADSRIDYSYVVFSPDRKYFATRSSDEVRVWKVIGNIPKLVSRINHDKLWSFQFSPDGSLLLTGGGDATVRVWRNWQQQPVESAVVHLSLPFYEMAVSQKGKYLATMDSSGTVSVWKDWNSKAPYLLSTSKHPSPYGYFWIRPLVFTENESRLLQEVTDNVILTIDPATGRTLSRSSVSRLINGWKFLVTVSANHVATVSDVVEGRALATFDGINSKSIVEATSLVYCEATHSLALQQRGAIGVVRSDSNLLSTIPRRYSESTAVDFSPDGRLLAVTDRMARIVPAFGESFVNETERADRAGGQVDIWSISSDAPVEVARIESNEQVRTVIFGSAGSQITTFTSKSMRLWAPIGYREERKLDVDGDVRALAVSPDGKHVAAIAGSMVYILEITTGRQVVAPFEPGYYSQYPRSLAFSPDGQFLYIDSILSTSTWTDWLKTPRLLGTWWFSGDHFEVSPDGHYLALGTGSIAVGDSNRRDDSQYRPFLLSNQEGILAHTFSHDGRFLITVGRNGLISILDRWQSNPPHIFSTFRLAQDGNLDEKASWSLAVSPSDEFLACSTGDRIYLFRNWSDDVMRSKAFQLSAISASKIVFSPDGKYLAATNYDVISVWDLNSGSEMARIPQRGVVSDVEFSRDGQYLIAGGEHNLLGLWLWRQSDMVKKACELINESGITLTNKNFAPSFAIEDLQKTCSTASAFRPSPPH